MRKPRDLAKALSDDATARVAFDRLPFGSKRKHVGAIEESKSPEVRERRIDKPVEVMKQSARGALCGR